MSASSSGSQPADSTAPANPDQQYLKTLKGVGFPTDDPSWATNLVSVGHAICDNDFGLRHWNAQQVIDKQANVNPTQTQTQEHVSWGLRWRTTARSTCP